jgi:hypothetical protein
MRVMSHRTNSVVHVDEVLTDVFLGLVMIALTVGVISLAHTL